MIAPEILAAFTCARRMHEGLTPARLDLLLDCPRGATRAIEQQRQVKPSTRLQFIHWNFPESEKETDNGLS